MESEYDIPLDDFNIPYVTQDEMKELLTSRKKKWENPKYEELQQDENTGLYFTEYFIHSGGDLLQAHLLVEQSLEHLDELDWKRMTNGYDSDIISRIQHVIENPLVWVEEIPDELARQFVVTGKVAVEKSSEERNTCVPYSDLHILLSNERTDWFASQLPTSKDVDPEYNYYGVPTDMILWDKILTDPYEKISSDLYAPQKANPYTGHVFWPYFNPGHFRQEIEHIRTNFGPQKAAQIVRLLRDDWQDIKVLKLFGIDELTPDQVEEFRLCLFEGMERNLRNWEAQETKPEISAPDCPFIDHYKLAQTGIYTSDEFKNMLRQACEQDAPTLGAFLKKHFKTGYLDFHGASKKKIYETLKASFPGTMNYSYVNFTQYFI